MPTIDGDFQGSVLYLNGITAKSVTVRTSDDRVNSCYIACTAKTQDEIDGITVSEGEKISVSATYPQSLSSSTSTENRGLGSIFKSIFAQKPARPASIHILNNTVAKNINISGSMINGQMINNMVVVDPSLEIVIEAPTNFKIIVGDNNASIDIGDVRTFEYKKGGVGDVTVGNVAEAEINSGAVGNLTVGNCNTLYLNTDGVGDIRIGDVMDSSTIIADGVGKIALGRVRGVTKIEHSGVGNISMAYVVGSLNINKSGVGKVTVQDCRIDGLVVVNDGVGNVSICGTANYAELTNTGVGNIIVDNVTGSLNKNSEGIGKIRVGNR